MRLYLSSYKFGNHIEKLLDLVPNSQRKAVIVMNAVDWGDSEKRRMNYEKYATELSDIGFEVSELDLRKYFDRTEKDLESFLHNVGLVFVVGGNSFLLKRAFEQSEFESIIKKFLKEDRIVYAGFSAGVCILAPSLEGIDLVDDPKILADGYKNDFNQIGLNVIPYSLAVHYRSDHPESDAVEREVAYFEEKHIPYRTLRDGEVLIINGDEEMVLS
jgi:dipeptidase E